MPDLYALVRTFVDRCDEIRNGNMNRFYSHVDRFCKEANTALEAWGQREGQQGWQPITTAPKDGTLILLFRSVSPWKVLGYGKWVNDFGIEGWLSYGFVDPPGNLGLADPSHWMPLPALPSSSPSSNGETK